MKVMKLFAVALVAGMFMVGCEGKKEEAAQAPVTETTTTEVIATEVNTTETNVTVEEANASM